MFIDEVEILVFDSLYQGALPTALMIQDLVLLARDEEGVTFLDRVTKSILGEAPQAMLPTLLERETDESFAGRGSACVVAGLKGECANEIAGW